MARQVVVFGAGASRSFGVPTMDRFIDVAEDLRTSGKSIARDDFDLFFDALQNRFRQLHAKSAVDLDNIEAVFGLVEMARLIRRLPGFDREQIVRLGSAIRTVLVQTIQQSGTFEYTPDQRWLPPQAYLSIAGYLDGRRQKGESVDIAFITFNYDLGFDFALHWSNFGVDYGLGDGVAEGIKLYKLHGSLNWITCRRCGAVRPLTLNQILQAHAGTREMGRSSIQLVLDPARAYSSIGGHCPGDDPPYQTTLVPPSWNKTQYWSELGNVWSNAAEHLAGAQEITIVGYSLPQTDSFFRDLLALGLVGPARVRSFNVVNPDSSVAAKFGALLGPELKSRLRADQRTFEEWAQETYGPGPRVK